ncbi:TetR/AcrR family transcriptional regulator [Hydrogenimonas urashimensis]|uniref:TetR/AcrR family transcriptional regulator n=1 Tax=Hydrogenimonas urashimensis TaxID=2740515 RepID=UPI0019157351|nr:TetR/AcrR family transcriptional regulator [Hydrogenimonas urashimensis]
MSTHTTVKHKIRQKVEEAKKEIILDAVSDYFETVGFSEPKMQDIAKAVGISVGALYKLFPSKDALFFAYVGHQIEQFSRKLADMCEDVKDPQKCLVLYIQLKFSTFASKRKAIEDPVIGDPLFFVKMNTRKENPAAAIFEFLAEQFERLARKKPLKSSNHMKTAYLFNAATMGYIEYWLNFGGGLEEKAEEVFDRIMNGIGA